MPNSTNQWYAKYYPNQQKYHYHIPNFKRYLKIKPEPAATGEMRLCQYHQYFYCAEIIEAKITPISNALLAKAVPIARAGDANPQ